MNYNNTSDNASNHTPKTGQLRPTVFCLIVDFKNNLILVENQSRLVGGGIDKGETPEQTCIREILEETENAIVVDKDRLHFFRVLEFKTKEFFTDNQHWYGKKGNIYVYEYDSNIFTGLKANTTDNIHGELSWCDINKFFTINDDINEDEFRQFCKDKKFTSLF